MTDQKQSPLKKHLKGWQVLLVASVLYLVSGFVFGSFIGKLVNVTGSVLVIIAIVLGIINLAKYKKFSGEDIAGTILTIIIFVAALSMFGSLTKI